ncbi:MAG TPA: DMT family transporter [Gammaproteobacteria bacterium]|nr:DMT family transporter [Gammaproteobacteria bacterium]
MQANILLLMSAAIWGFAFVYQRQGMEYLGPFMFGAIRFLLGSLALSPLLWWRRFNTSQYRSVPIRKILLYGSISGMVLFTAASLQQVGLQYTTAGKAGFITGLYIILVPLLGLGLGHRTHMQTWIGATLAVSGLYLLSFTENMSLAIGDLLQLGGALFWAVHVLVIGRFSPQVSPIALSVVQFAVCGLLSLLVALFVETTLWSQVVDARTSILYTGLISTSIGFTLQVLAQRIARPTHAAIIMSLEAVFAVVGGWWLLNEILTKRALLGSALMLAGMLISQIKPRHNTAGNIDSVA